MEQKLKPPEEINILRGLSFFDGIFYASQSGFKTPDQAQGQGANR
jgi:hypothetical protein